MGISPGFRGETAHSRRVLVLGLDGATFDILQPMAEDGRIPNLARLMKEGSHGVLESTVPPVTIPAWVSMLTGKNPGKLGVYDLVRRNGYGVEPNAYCYRGQSPLWHILNAYGIKTGLMNIPGTYPPEEVDGFMVTGMMTPSEGSVFCHPMTLASELDSTVSKYEIDVRQWQYSDEAHFIKDAYRITEKRGRAAEHLIRSVPCEFYMIVFTSGDRMQHVLWNKRAVIEEYWEKLDRVIGRILRLFGDDTAVFVVSDHGFGPVARTFYVNEWLRRRGYLRVKRSMNERLVAKVGEFMEGLYRFLGEKKLLYPLTVFLNKAVGFNRVMKYTFAYLATERLEARVNWRKTKAFSSVHTPSFGHIYLNAEGMEHGRVSEGERDELLRSILEDFSRLSDPDTSERLRVDAYTAEELYIGPHVDEAPDIVFIVDGGRCEFDAKVGDGILFEDGAPLTGWTGTHTMNGVFIARGPGIRREQRVEGVRIIDVAPTVLGLLGIAPPSDMDGRVLEEIFVEDAGEMRKAAPLSVSGGGKGSLSEDEKELIEDRLRKLGYIT